MGKLIVGRCIISDARYPAWGWAVVDDFENLDLNSLNYTLNDTLPLCSK